MHATFALFATKPRSKVVSKNSNLTQRVTLLKDAMKLTRRQLDRFATGFLAINQNSFFTEWRRSRKLVPYGTLTTRASLPLKRKTPKERLDSEQFITVKAPGFEQPVHAGPFTFKKGKATHIVINMNQFNIPAPANTNSNVNA